MTFNLSPRLLSFIFLHILETTTTMLKSPLIKVAVGGAVFVLGAAAWMENRLQRDFRQQDYYQQAVIMLHKYEPAAEFLGRPIYGGRVDLGDTSKFKVELIKATLNIPLKGPKGKGALHVLASREKLGDKWNIDQLDLEVFSSQQRWKFYDRELSSQNPQQQSPSTVKTDPPTQL